MPIQLPTDLLNLEKGTQLPKKALARIIQYSKIENSEHWQGEEFRIGNTPQQGINWIGELPAIQALIIKSKTGKYAHDGWNEQQNFQYAFKERNGTVNYNEKANSLLCMQPQYMYPVLLFTEIARTNIWIYQGKFTVEEIREKYVTLTPFEEETLTVSLGEHPVFLEGKKSFSIHLITERNRKLVQLAKQMSASRCDICGLSFKEVYGFDYIEAHHIVPVAKAGFRHDVTTADIVLLCPNCHRAVHICMKQVMGNYYTVKEELQKQLRQSPAKRELNENLR